MMIKKYADFVFVYLAMSAFFALLALALFYPYHPVTFVGGIFWYFGVLPILMIGEGIGSIFINYKVGKFINKDTSSTSIGRIGYGVLVTIIILIIFGVFVFLIGEGLNPFLEKNFSNEW